MACRSAMRGLRRSWPQPRGQQHDRQQRAPDPRNNSKQPVRIVMRRLIVFLLLLAGSAAAVAQTDGSVGLYHGTSDRSGHYIVPGLTWQSAGAVRRDKAFDGRVDGHIYAQPL